MHLNSRPPLRDEKGMMIVQVVIVSGVLLALLLMGFRSVQVSIKSANTAASAAAFETLAISVQQTLAVTPICAANLGISGVSLAMITGAAGGYDVTVSPLPMLGLKPVAVVEPPLSNTRPASEFRITEVKIRNVQAVGIHAGGVPAAKPMGTYSADLEIVAERRANFLGSTVMRKTIPLVLGTTYPIIGGEAVRECTIKSTYTNRLGPPAIPGGVTRKVALDCIDRGGSAVLAPGQDWYVCRLPASSFGVCDTASGQTNLPGWVCYQSTQVDPLTNTGFTYVY